MVIKFVAFHLDLFYAWQKYFADCADVEIIDGDILEQEADALVSPANSFGYMDGGLDLKISQKLGWDIEKKVRQRLLDDFYGELPVGNALIVETGLKQFSYLVSAPTMRVPMDVSKTANAFLAFKAVLAEVKKFNAQGQRINSLACSGLGTGEGKMSAEQCARQMRAAYEVVILGKVLTQGGLAGAVRNHQFLSKHEERE
ncbi:macro domain-containing protein [uncultured Thiothrix sp.]|uniref:macro domain-containing protein n=1 Tax=uncultured Thiothrix sp. TaxID=223185 RepID=UPI002608EBA0|nr:macro domain-containing protein [uncultured Thiothrix sp.]